MLNITRQQTRSQCNLLRRGVIWSNLGTKQTTRAAALRTLCNGHIGTVGDHRAMSYSNQDAR